jgi:hypothetical protein
MAHRSVVGGKCVDSSCAWVWGIEYATERLYTLWSSSREGCSGSERVAMARESSTWIVKRASPAENASPWWVARECSAVSSVSSRAMTSPRRCAQAHQPHMPRPSRPQTESSDPSPIQSSAHSPVHRQSSHDILETAQHRIGPAHLTSEPQQSPSSRPAAFCIRRLSCSPTRLDTLFAQTNHATKSSIVSRTPDLCAAPLKRSRCSLHFSNHSY